MGSQGVGPAGGVQYDQGLVAAPPRRHLETVAGLVTETAGIDIVALGGPDPAFFRHHHGDGIGTDHLQLAEGPGLFPLYQRRATRVAVLFRHSQQLFLDQGLEAGGAAEDFLQFIALLGQLVLLSAYGDLFQLGQVAQLEL